MEAEDPIDLMVWVIVFAVLGALIILMLLQIFGVRWWRHLMGRCLHGRKGHRDPDQIGW